jgi:hypothetical protein
MGRSYSKISEMTTGTDLSDVAPYMTSFQQVVITTPILSVNRSGFSDQSALVLLGDRDLRLS